MAKHLVALGAFVLSLPILFAQGRDVRYEVDVAWPKPLPNQWVLGGLGGVCVDAQDHVFILNRQDVADGDLNAGRLAPQIIEFDAAGAVVHSWGDPSKLDPRLHSCFVDTDTNIWIGSSPSGMVQKYTHDGRTLLAADRPERDARFVRRHSQGRAAQLERCRVLHAVEHCRRSTER